MNSKNSSRQKESSKYKYVPGDKVKIVVKKELFDKIDTDKSGYIDVSELDFGLKASGLSMTSYELKSMMDFADDNHDGKISKEEFVNIVDKSHLRMVDKVRFLVPFPSYTSPSNKPVDSHIKRG